MQESPQATSHIANRMDAEVGEDIPTLPLEEKRAPGPPLEISSQVTNNPLDDSIDPSSQAIGTLADGPATFSSQHLQASSDAIEDVGPPDDDVLKASSQRGEDPMQEVPSGSIEGALDSEHVDALSLPQAKIRRIMQMDPAYVGVSRGAVYATGLATELFIQHLTEQASLMAKVDRRKKVQYKDLSSAVDHHDAFSFLSDTIPKTQILADLVKNKSIALSTDPLPLEPDFSIPSGHSLHEAPEIPVTKKKQDHPKPAPASLPKGQQTLAFSHNPVSGAGPAPLIDLVSTEAQSSSADVIDTDVEMQEVVEPGSTS